MAQCYAELTVGQAERQRLGIEGDESAQSREDKLAKGKIIVGRLLGLAGTRDHDAETVVATKAAVISAGW